MSYKKKLSVHFNHDKIRTLVVIVHLKIFYYFYFYKSDSKYRYSMKQTKLKPIDTAIVIWIYTPRC